MEADVEKLVNYQEITVWDLKEFLKNYPDDYTVIISKDGEGNLFSPMAKGVSVGRWEPDNPFVGEFEYDDENPTCIAFFPVS